MLTAQQVWCDLVFACLGHRRRITAVRVLSLHVLITQGAILGHHDDAIQAAQEQSMHVMNMQNGREHCAAHWCAHVEACKVSTMMLQHACHCRHHHGRFLLRATG